MAPSKTFNIAGIVSSFAVIPNKKSGIKYLEYLEPRELSQGTIFAYTATTTAFEDCDDWLVQMIDYVEGNVHYVNSYLEKIFHR